MVQDAVIERGWKADAGEEEGKEEGKEESEEVVIKRLCPSVWTSRGHLPPGSIGNIIDS